MCYSRTNVTDRDPTKTLRVGYRGNARKKDGTTMFDSDNVRAARSFVKANQASPFDGQSFVPPVEVSMSMSVRFESITPERAKYLLSRRSDKIVLEGADAAGNREVNFSRVEKYVREMAGGWWEPTHQGIALDRDGFLIDGQHRLWAVVLSGTTATMMVTEGVNPDTFYLLDQGFSRGASSFLTGKYAAPRTALARSVMHLMERGGSVNVGNVVGPHYPTHTLLHFLESNPQVTEYGMAYAGDAERVGRILKGTSAGGLLYGGFLVGEENWGSFWDDANLVADMILEPGTGGEGLPDGHPLRALAMCGETGGNLTAKNHIRAVIAGNAYSVGGKFVRRVNGEERTTRITERLEKRGVFVDLAALGLSDAYKTAPRRRPQAA